VFGGTARCFALPGRSLAVRTPVLGINTGSIGFLTAVRASQLGKALKQVFSGEFTFESRHSFMPGEYVVDAMSTKAPLMTWSSAVAWPCVLIELDVRVDGELLTRYRCDGLILSSPTGSTAYSLAAGGAVIFPRQCDCPDADMSSYASNRALILPSSANVEVEVVSPKPETMMSVDGQVVSELMAGDKIMCVSKPSKPCG
jgi:NAD+ kinase